MKIPKKITILGRSFDVQLVGEKWFDSNNLSGACGALNFSKRSIAIKNTLSKEDKLVTLLHECHHAIDYICGFSQAVSGERFEIEAESRANGFYDVFKAIK